MRRLCVNGDETIRQAIGKVLKRTRKARKMSQSVAASKLGGSRRWSQGFISRIERGDGGLPMEAFVRMALLYGIPPSTLLSEAEWTGAFEVVQGETGEQTETDETREKSVK